MTPEQSTAAYNAVTSALIALGVTPRDALYAAEAATQCLHKWDTRISMLNDAQRAQREQDDADRERDHEERVAYLERLRADITLERLRGDITPEEAAQELADLEDERRMLDQEQPDD